MQTKTYTKVVSDDTGIHVRFVLERQNYLMRLAGKPILLLEYGFLYRLNTQKHIPIEEGKKIFNNIYGSLHGLAPQDNYGQEYMSIYMDTKKMVTFFLESVRLMGQYNLSPFVIYPTSLGTTKSNEKLV